LLGRFLTQKGDQVRFSRCDVFLPEANANELDALFRDTQEVEGIVVGFSDSGRTSGAFALVEVIQRLTMVIPVERLKPRHDPD